MIASSRESARQYDLPWIEPAPHEVPVCELRGQVLIYLCPGCWEYHGVPVGRECRELIWWWNGSVVRPTLEPPVIKEQMCDLPRCHHTLRAGVLTFRQDCGHAAKGQSIPLALYKP